MDIYFTSDSHYGHSRILEYAGRSRWATVEDMNEGLLEIYNRTVKPGDLVYHLGDFAFLKPHEIQPLVKKHHGQIHLLRGNHDRFLENKNRDFGFAWVGDYKEIKVGTQKIILAHYPFLTWSGRHHGTWSLHGHCHGSLRPDFGTKRLDVGVDSVFDWISEYRPVSFEEIGVMMTARGIQPVDHHERRGGDE